MNINLTIPDWLLIVVCVLFGVKTILESINAYLDWLQLIKASEK